MAENMLELHMQCCSVHLLPDFYFIYYACNLIATSNKAMKMTVTFIRPLQCCKCNTVLSMACYISASIGSLWFYLVQKCVSLTFTASSPCQYHFKTANKDSHHVHCVFCSERKIMLSYLLPVFCSIRSAVSLIVSTQICISLTTFSAAQNMPIFLC